ncbi:MAG: efflux RND transporter periplasmic adaptor subunit [Burkholderiaceae bacterium]|nr:efflux RND transporter periplasmic adaptor subunit [Burkholderiaceae bacterium]MDO9088719.1 efflux RND transporter periplasmic adaptor subunit [Burkholderiaceae bacterium]
MQKGLKRTIQWAILFIVLGLIALGVWRALQARQTQQASVAQAAAAPAQVGVELAEADTVTAQTRELLQGLPIAGTLKAARYAMVKARVAGELQGLSLREGDTVRAGQVIARVESAEYLARVRQAREQADAAKAQIDIARRQYDNNKALVNQGFISTTALDASQSSLAAAQSSHQAALAAQEVAQKALDDTVLRAPISGQVSQRLAQPGERVGVDARVVEIVDLSLIELEAALGGAESLGVKLGQTAQLRIEGGATPVAARVVRINPSAQAGSRSVLVYLQLDPAAGLRQGLFAQGTLGTARTRALSIPAEALRSDKPAPYVQVVENQAVVHRAVSVTARGLAEGEAMVAVSGLAEGTRVIKGAIGALREGTPVRFTGQPPAAKAAGSRATP